MSLITECSQCHDGACDELLDDTYATILLCGAVSEDEQESILERMTVSYGPRWGVPLSA